ncbi:G-type lectin S-receptor-like serine/threonine-protein kinase At4g27290 [Citrus clementina]|uniref:G-type lectin S-receptor-like serine/threonine-protein kinase At4g27290 n=1 Tax=Citrus clementina TaxID=85681 RepID=UPI000CECE834|nr:G-type lectin S-receptor-like serine/threonine-protein kinase At4g27290 [Citrus x clementina]
MKCLPAFDFFSLFSFILIIEFSFAADSIARGESITDGETLVSSFQSFELGFFSPGNSSNRYLGIWYKKSPRTVAWVANRNNAITDKSGVLTLSNNGSLLLLNQEKRSIWSSNSSRVLQNPVVQLLDSGNLVLRSNVSRSSDEYVWQSFDYPSDTLLPEMKLGLNLKTGFERYLTPWRSADDPTPGDFSFRLDNSTAVPELVTFMGSSKRARSGPWNGQTFEGIPWMKDSGYELIVEHKEDEIYYKFKLINDTVTTRLQLENTGTYHRFVWDETTSEWHKLYSWPFDHCDNYAECGANSNCRISKTPSCECLTGFISKSQEDWDSPDSRSCVRKPSDCPGGEGFLKLPKMKLPENYWSNQSMSLRECEAECTKNCSCRAYANSQVVGGGNGCLMWFGDLIDIKECSEKYVWGQDFFIRVPTSDLESSKHSNKKKRLKIIVAISIISGMFILCLLLCMARKKAKNKGYRRRVDQENQDQIEDLELPLFELATIANATDNFSINNKLGEGGFGRVYKGTLVDGQEIAVKRLSKISEQGLNELKNEVILFSKLQHRNLVKLLGCCIQGEEKLLIYEFMPNKSLDYFIFDQTKRELLDWSKRFHIICGTARGLLYLHQDSRLRIIPRDLKTSNVLLDHDMNPKISNFGLARTFGGDEIEGSTNKVIGTYGYMAPEYATDGLFSVKSDVFSFGILVLEIVSGKRNRGLYNSDNKFNVIRHAWNLWNKGMPWQLIDACYQESCNPDEVIRCIHISLLCVQHHPEDRPSMPSVILMLGSDSVLPQPKQPGFLVDRKSTGPDSSSSKPESSSTNASTFTELEGR